MSTFEALIIDLDQTTVRKGWGEMPSESVVNAIHKAKEKLKISTASGRPLRMCADIWRVLDLDSPCIIDDGAQILDPKTHKPIWQLPIPEDTVAEILRLTPCNLVEIAFDSKKMDSSGNGERGHERVCRISVRGINKANSQELFDVYSQLPDLTLDVHSSWRKAGDTDIDITHKLATKKTAIEKLIEITGTKKENVIGVGDNFNDLPMFEAVGYRVAMGNAIDELKKSADFVTTSIEEDGLAYFIRNHLLK